jgi:hypothetical protein
MSANDSPTSTAQCEIFQQISKMGIGQQVNTLTLWSIQEAIEDLKSDMRNKWGFTCLGKCKQHKVCLHLIPVYSLQYYCFVDFYYIIVYFS